MEPISRRLVVICLEKARENISGSDRVSMCISAHGRCLSLGGGKDLVIIECSNPLLIMP
jgi:hypothetical protein